jgi:hypothetical protein
VEPSWVWLLLAMFEKAFEASNERIAVGLFYDADMIARLL